MQKKKSIALVGNTSWSMYNFRLGLIRGLQQEGYEVTVIAPKDNFTSKLVAEGINYHEISISNYGTNPITELKLIRRFYKTYKKIRPDMIFHYTIKPNIYGSIAAAFCKIPSIIVTTGLGQMFQFKNFFVRWITLTFYRIATFLAKEVWFLNDNDKDVFVFKRIVRKSKARVLKSEGIDTNWFKPRKQKKFYIDRFLFAGRLIWDKGVREFVEAAKIVKKNYPQVRFELLGFIDQSNPNSVPYDTINEWQKKRIITYLGETSDIRPYMEKASCLVFPSFYREGVSRVLMEAASMETPIITTDNVGCKEIVDHNKNGFVVDINNVNELAQAIESFIELEDNDKLVMGKLGRKKMIDQYDQNKVVDFYLKTISRILGKRKSTKSDTRTEIKAS